MLCKLGNASRAVWAQCICGVLLRAYSRRIVPKIRDVSNAVQRIVVTAKDALRCVFERLGLMPEHMSDRLLQWLSKRLPAQLTGNASRL
ncbi:hypothetical protein NOV72_04351 [Caballeronia novacaledonica]|uniref:Uncharacterized protein n=1 Tax=Caballeronia novacaledonica TaxID=1544861 RepID=A0A2U3IAK7_9BURK|nr:hypothetical protein [Caballeronia novacaledonica]SPB17147.1 hypothetical protein NOV72_04351 [Caballeronia novacaledonica]